MAWLLLLLAIMVADQFAAERCKFGLVLLFQLFTPWAAAFPVEAAIVLHGCYSDEYFRLQVIGFSLHGVIWLMVVMSLL